MYDVFDVHDYPAAIKKVLPVKTVGANIPPHEKTVQKRRRKTSFDVQTSLRIKPNYTPYCGEDFVCLSFIIIIFKQSTND